MKLSIWDEASTLVPGSGSLRYYDPQTGRKAPRVHYTDKLDRLNKKQKIQEKLLAWKAGKGPSVSIPLVVFEDYLTELRLGILDKKGPRRESTIQIKRESLTRFLEVVYQMDQITTQTILDWKVTMAGKYSVDTIALRLRDLRAFLKWATGKGYFEISPFTGVSIPISEFIGRKMANMELLGLVQKADSVFKTFLTIAIETGARHGEILGAEWKELDFQAGSWIIPASKCKTKRTRIIPLSKIAIKAWSSLPRIGSRPFEGWNRFRTQRNWTRLKAIAGITGRARIHDLRHTAASNWQGRRASLKAMFGWTTDEMASKYDHIEFEGIKADLERGGFGAVFGANEAKNESKA